MCKNDDNNNNLPVQPEVEPSPVESGGQPDNGGKKDRSNLHQRLITAIFIAVLYIAPILLGFYVNELFYDALVVFLMCAASYEFSRCRFRQICKTDKLIRVYQHRFRLRCL